MLRLFTLQQVAARLEVDVGMVRKWIRNGALPAMTAMGPRLTRIRSWELEQFILEHRLEERVG